MNTHWLIKERSIVADPIVELAEKYGLINQTSIHAGLSSLKRSQVRNLNEELKNALSEEKASTSSIQASSYNFFASTSLRGDRLCHHPLCKLKKIPVIERFAALYGDCLILPIALSDGTLDDIRESLAAVFLIAAELRPLIDSKIVIPVPTQFCLCKNCGLRFREKKEYISSIADLLAKRHLGECTVRYLGHSGKFNGFNFELYGPEHLIEGGSAIRQFRTKPDWFDTAFYRAGNLLSEQCVEDSGIVRDFFNTCSFDLASQSYYADSYGCSYLSDSGAEAEFFGTIEEDGASFSSIDVVRELTHEIPLFSELSSSSLLSLRREFPEAFLAYRGALSESFASNDDLKSGGKIRTREFYRDVLEPKLNALKALEASAKKLQFKNAALSIGLPVISLAAGMVDSSLPGSVAEFLKVAGELGIAKSLMDPFLERNKKTAELQSSQHFFLLQMDKEWTKQQKQCSVRHGRKGK
jgi:hypothetical protein